MDWHQIFVESRTTVETTQDKRSFFGCCLLSSFGHGRTLDLWISRVARVDGHSSQCANFTWMSGAAVRFLAIGRRVGEIVLVAEQLIVITTPVGRRKLLQRNYQERRERKARQPQFIDR